MSSYRLRRIRTQHEETRACGADRGSPTRARPRLGAPCTRLALGVLLVACDAAAILPDAGTDAGPLIPSVTALPVLDAANALGPEHPRFEGQQRFLWDAFGTERVGNLPPAAFLLELMDREPEVFGDQLAGFGFVRDPSDELPVGLKRGLEDPERVQTTCALCHVARLPSGEVWIGAPNTELEWGRFLLELDARWTAAGNAPLFDAREREKLAVLGPGRTRAESDSYEQAVPADFPPYFALGRRTALNYLGTGGNLRTEVFLSVYTFGAGNPNPRRAIVPFPAPARLDPMIAFMGEIDPPPAPAQDAARVDAGRAIFLRERCDSCHALDDPSALGVVTYDRAVDGRERYPDEDEAFPRGSIRTSRLHRVLVDGDGMGGGIDMGYVDLLNFITSNELTTRLSDGYRSADLHGLWATAPYLHNGSVPTLEDLLRPAAERPSTFVRGSFTVDTTQPGNDNGGHEFGTAIDEEDRAALAAYLRSL